MNALMSGAVAMGSFVIALFFVRFWRTTDDRFFLYFALSFAIEGALRIYISVQASSGESSPLHYLVRLAAYLLILWAIWEKNRPATASR